MSRAAGHRGYEHRRRQQVQHARRDRQYRWLEYRGKREQYQYRGVDYGERFERGQRKLDERYDAKRAPMDRGIWIETVVSDDGGRMVLVGARRSLSYTRHRRAVLRSAAAWGGGGGNPSLAGSRPPAGYRIAGT